MNYTLTARGALLATTAAAACVFGTPARAQDATATAPGTDWWSAGLVSVTARAEPVPVSAEPITVSEERLVAMGVIRPFGGGIRANAGNIRTFAGSVSGTAGNIRTFTGDVNASAGNIRTFAGNIRTFAGNIRTFWDQTMPLTGPDQSFWGSAYPASGTLVASAGNIRTFAGQFEAQAGNIRTFAGNIRTFDGTLLTWTDGTTQYKSLASSIGSLVATTKASWGTTVQAQTGKTFEEAFSNRMLTKYGISLTDPKSLVGMDEVGVELFLLDWYDNLMLYSGSDQVDHWMKAVNWTPALTQALGSGADTKIGILDFGVSQAESGNNLVSWAGYSTVGQHGSAVSSLIMAKHDGRGVMGIAPAVKVIGYNPFDATNTASWTDVAAGVRYMMGNGATVINASLGVPGTVLSSSWNDIFKDSWMSTEAKKRVFVLAAGNEGVAQSKDNEVTWDFDRNPNIIIVGSVDPNGTISAFSNRPGEGKFKKLAGNDPLGTDMLRDRFIVAPGEFMLVSDGQGGVTRMSGTSFAAPLVAGTIALVHDRWPWLADNPVDTVNVILKTARDIGAPGVDDVYGRGMLDVGAALSPANFFALQWKQVTNGVTKTSAASTVLASSNTTVSSWEANKVYFSVFETTGILKDSYRDFAIPMSTKLVGQTVGTTNEQFSGYLQGRFWEWFNGNRTNGFAGTVDDFAPRQFSAQLSGFTGGAVATAIASPRQWRPGLRQSNVPFDTAFDFRSAGGVLGFRMGSGGGTALTGQRGFAMQSDYDVVNGGANPFLGLASGSGFAAVDVALGGGLSVSTGVSRQDAVLDVRRMSPQEQLVMGGIDPYRATANTMTLNWRGSDRFTANIGYTLLNEATGLLGVRSLDRNDLAEGSRTDAITSGASWGMTPTLTLSLTGTLGRTRAGDPERQNIAVSSGGLLSTSWQVAVGKAGLFDGQDRARLTLAQPLHVERGRLAVSGVEVIDRQTGELGVVTQVTDFDRGTRRFVAEALYGRSVMDGRAEVNLFGRANLVDAASTGQGAVTAGGSFRLAF